METPKNEPTLLDTQPVEADNSRLPEVFTDERNFLRRGLALGTTALALASGGMLANRLNNESAYAQAAENYYSAPEASTSNEYSIDNWVVKDCTERAIGVPLFKRGVPTPYIARETHRYTLGSRRVRVGLKLRYLQTPDGKGREVDCSQLADNEVTVQMVKKSGYRIKAVGRLAAVHTGEVTNYTDGNVNRTAHIQARVNLDHPLRLADFKPKKHSKAKRRMVGVRTTVISTPKVQPEFPGSTPQNPVPKEYYGDGFCSDPFSNTLAPCTGYPEDLKPKKVTKIHWIKAKEVKRSKKHHSHKH